MKRFVIAVAVALSLIGATTLAQPAPESAPTPIERVVTREREPVPAPKVAAAPKTAPAPALPLPTEPQNAEQWMHLAIIAVQAFQNAVNLGTLGAFAFAALCSVYLLMYLGKTALKANLPDHYKKLLRPVLGLLTLAATGLGYYLGGIPLAGAAGIGALLSGVSHDALDALRALKK